MWEVLQVLSQETKTAVYPDKHGAVDGGNMCPGQREGEGSLNVSDDVIDFW